PLPDALPICPRTAGRSLWDRNAESFRLVAAEHKVRSMEWRRRRAFGDLMLERCHRLARLGDPRQNLARVNKQSFAGFGQNHRARQSIEQLLVQFLFQLMDLLTERRLRDMLALRRIREAALLRDSDKVPELMNLHRRSDTPLGPPVCLRLADRMVAAAKGVRTGGS